MPFDVMCDVLLVIRLVFHRIRETSENWKIKEDHLYFLLSYFFLTENLDTTERYTGFCIK